MTIPYPDGLLRIELTLNTGRRFQTLDDLRDELRGIEEMTQFALEFDMRAPYQSMRGQTAATTQGRERGRAGTPDYTVHVERMRYENPIEIILWIVLGTFGAAAAASRVVSVWDQAAGVRHKNAARQLSRRQMQEISSLSPAKTRRAIENAERIENVQVTPVAVQELPAEIAAQLGIEGGGPAALPPGV